MPKDAHNKAAEHHENAAKSHRAAAQQHGQNDHVKGKEHSTSAQQHSQNARQQSEQAHTKSQQTEVTFRFEWKNPWLRPGVFNCRPEEKRMPSGCTSLSRRKLKGAFMVRA